MKWTDPEGARLAGASPTRVIQAVPSSAEFGAVGQGVMEDFSVGGAMWSRPVAGWPRVREVVREAHGFPILLASPGRDSPQVLMTFRPTCPQRWASYLMGVLD